MSAIRVFPEDVAEMHLVYGDERVMKTITGKALTLDETRTRIEMHTEHWDRCGYGLWIAKIDGAVAGQIMLMRRLPDCPAIELGYAFLPQYWRMGYATEAARYLLGIAFEDLKEPEVIAITALGNDASKGVMLKNGMKFRRRYLFQGSGESALFGIDVEEWKLLRSGFQPALRVPDGTEQ